MIRHAKKAALRSTFRYRLGAVIAKGDRILSSASNEIRHCRAVPQAFPESLHAEAAAISKLLHRRLHDLAGSTMYICRVNRSGLASLARPCPDCLDLIKSVGVRKIVYTTGPNTTVSECV